MSPAAAPTPAQIRALRDARGWSQSALASRLGVSTSTVQDYEQDRYPPGSSVAIILRDLAEHAAYDPARPDSYTVIPAA